MTWSCEAVSTRTSFFPEASQRPKVELGTDDESRLCETRVGATEDDSPVDQDLSVLSSEEDAVGVGGRLSVGDAESI